VTAIGPALLAAAAATVPFLVQYQEVTVRPGASRRTVRALLVTYDQVAPGQLPLERRGALRDLLARVRLRWHEARPAERAALRQAYREAWSSGGGTHCAEVLMIWPDDDGVRYRACLSPGGGVVRVVEDLTLPDRLLWSFPPRDPEARARLDALLDELIAQRGGSEPRERSRIVEALRAAARTDAPPVVLEVAGAWDEVEPGALGARLAASWPSLSPGFARRAAVLFRFLRAIHENRLPELADLERGGAVTASPLLRTLGFDPAAVLGGEGAEAGLSATPVSWSGVLPGFEPVPEELARRFYPRGRWDPPRPGLSLAERAERLERGRGW